MVRSLLKTIICSKCVYDYQHIKFIRYDMLKSKGILIFETKNHTKNIKTTKMKKGMQSSKKWVWYKKMERYWV